MVTEYISQAWNAYRKNFWQIIGGMLLVALVTVGIILLTGIPLFVNLLQYYSSSSVPSPAFAGFLMDGTAQSLIALFAAGIVVAIIAGTALEAGLVKMFSDALGGRARIGTIFAAARKRFRTIIGANILAGLIRVVLLLVLVLPPFMNILKYSLFMTYISSTPISAITPSQIAAVVWLYGSLILYFLLVLPFALVNQSVVVGNYRAVESVKKSFFIVKQNYLQFLGLVVLLALISVAVSFVPILGSLISAFAVGPVALLSYTAFYIDKSRGEKRRAARKGKAKRKR